MRIPFLNPESPVMFRYRFPLVLLFWLAAIAGSTPAAAAVVTYDFTVNATSGPLASQSFSGSFSFDDAAPPSLGFGGESLYALTSFDFEFDGVGYQLTDLDYGDAAFDRGTFLGLDAGSAVFSFLPAIGDLPPAFFYDFGSASTQQSGDGDVTYRVPEPAAPLLAAMAMGAMLLSRRRS